MATVWFCFQTDEKPPPGFQLLVTQQVSHICYIVLFASSKDRRPCCQLQWDFLSSCFHKGSVWSVRISRGKPPPPLPGIQTDHGKLLCFLGCIAVITHRFQLLCSCKIRNYLHRQMPPHVLFKYSEVISWRLWSVIARKPSRMLQLQVSPLGLCRNSAPKTWGISLHLSLIHSHIG